MTPPPGNQKQEAKMKLKKAIEILTINNDHNPNFTDADRRDALKLGIEAMKRLRTYRERKYYYARTLLPGETEE